MQDRVMFHRDDGADPRLPPLTVVVKERAEKNERMSQHGAPVFDRVIQLEVTPTGQKSGVIYTPRRILPDGVIKDDAQVIKRFRGLWEEYLRGAEPASDGTPLEQWPLMDVALVAALKEAKIYTVQQLAGLSEGVFDNVRIPKVREWRAKAQAWLEDAGNAAAQVEMRAELAKRDEKIELLQKQVQELLSNQNGGTPGFEKRRGKKRAGADGDDIPVSLPADLDEQHDLDEARV